MSPLQGDVPAGDRFRQRGDSPWHFLHMCHEIFPVFIIPAVGWAQKRTTNAGVGILGMVVGPSNPQALAEQPPSLGPTGNKVPAKENHHHFPPYKCHPMCLCLFNLSSCLLAFILIPQQSGRQVCLPFRSYCFEFAAQFSVSSRQSI